MYRLAMIGLITAMLFPVIFAGTAKASSAPETHGRAALLVDGQTGQLLYSLNPQARMYPASTTKVLTALVAVERAKLRDEITVSANAVNQPWDSTLAGLRAGEKLSLEQLLYGLMLPSGNDAAVAIAEGVAGSEAAFADLMNQKAADLGATHSHFTNASGLHDPKHYTTAGDLAIIAQAAFHNPILIRIASTEEYVLPGNRKITNHDGLLGYYDGIVAGKTGFTEQAGRTLVTLARRNQRELVGVVLDSRLLYTDMMAMLDYGFRDFTRILVVRAGESAGRLPVLNGILPSVSAVAAREFSYDLPVEAAVTPSTRATLYNDMRAPLAAGQKVGELTVALGDSDVGRIDLIADSAVAYRTPVVAMANQALTAKRWWTWTGAAGFLASTACLRLAYVARRRRRYRRLRYGVLSGAALNNRRPRP